MSRKKTGGSVLFDVRVDGDPLISRMAAIGYGAYGTVVITMAKNGQLASAPINGDSDHLVAELTAWCSLPMAEQICVSFSSTASILLAECRKSGRFDRSS
ncbi:hypothetical protein NKJ26_19915 [Mesorhizobium sp. M0152]|uniref:hypothetical protein n=1 Tax=Mesorhizobium sp. M0152 TaxID=2956898 RepID=UPI0033367FB5